jgi:prepilin-type N-terminal cleavage/methylation domain-containing protein/prepilin-type processing-associated H-X9-DG protein
MSLINRLIQRARRAFTLVELLVVMAIIAVLVSMLFPTFSTIKEHGRIVVCKSNLKSLHTAFVAYSQDNRGRFPRNGGGSNANKDGRIALYWMNGFDGWGTNGTLGILSGSIFPYLKDVKVFHCPSHPNTPGRDYVRSYEMADCLGTTGTIQFEGIMNEATGNTQFRRAETFAEVQRPSQTLLLVDDAYCEDGIWVRSDGRNRAGTYHLGGKANVLFVDGHVELLDRKRADMAYEAFFRQPQERDDKR